MKVYIKKYKLKNWVKKTLLIALIFTIMFGSLVMFKNKIEKIESGEIELVYQYGGDM